MFRNIRDGRYTKEFTAVAGPWPFERRRHRRRAGRSHRRMRPLTNAEFDFIISGEAAARRQRSATRPVRLPPPPAPRCLLRGALSFIPPLVVTTAVDNNHIAVAGTMDFAIAFGAVGCHHRHDVSRRRHVAYFLATTRDRRGVLTATGSAR